jgi:hypothetical protein
VASPYLVNHLIELQLLNYVEELATFGDVDRVIFAVYELTVKGKQFTEKWGLK